MDLICPGCYGFATSADWTFIFCGNDIDDIVVDCLNANSDREQLISEVFFLWLWASFRATVIQVLSGFQIKRVKPTDRRRDLKDSSLSFKTSLRDSRLDVSLKTCFPSISEHKDRALTGTENTVVFSWSPNTTDLITQDANRFNGQRSQ